MGTGAIFPNTPARAGMYESFYLRAVAPERPIGVWLRQTVHKPPGADPQGSVWCTVFDGDRPFMHKLTSDRLSVPAEGWIAVGDGGDAGGGPRAGALLGSDRALGACGAASWSLRFASSEPELRHLPREWLYRTPLPRTKLTSPAPASRFTGTLQLEGDEQISLDGWRGMVGHNWGSEHAERWIWLHGVGFEEEPEAWLDVAIGRIKLAGRMTPWIANGALSIGGRRLRLGGLGARRPRVKEGPGGCVVGLAGDHGLRVEVRADVPGGTAAGWHYADPAGGSGHDVINSSIAALELTVELPGDRASRRLHSAHGGVYELGMRERDHGVPIAPFTDG